MLLNKPSLGGREAYHDKQRTLDESIEMICGIAQGPNATNTPLGVVNSQALSFGKSIEWC